MKPFVYILNEDVISLRPQYQMISDNDYNTLIKMDPTYKGGDNLGKYTRWILDLYKKFIKDRKLEDKYKKSLEYKKTHPEAVVNEPVYQSQDKLEDFDKIKDLLKDYDKYKKDIKQDISFFKSIADLASAIRANKEKDIPVDEKATDNYRVFREAMTDGLKIVYNGSNFIIGVPETYEASSHFKKPVTDWCTAYPEMYDRYLQEYGGKYYIHLNKHTGDLYQLHYESNQFKDASDKEIDKKEFISKYPELKEFYDKILPMDNYKWWILHDKQPSEEEQLNVVKKKPNAIYYIANPSEAVQLEAVKNDGFAIQWIKNPTKESELEAVKQEGRSINYIKNPTEELYLTAVKQNENAIYRIKNPSKEVQLAALQKNPYVIKYIKNPCKEAIELVRKLREEG